LDEKRVIPLCMESSTREILRQMSRENVELVRKLTEAWQRREQEGTLDFVDPDVEWDATGLGEAIPDIAGVYQGHDGVRAYWRRWLSAWRDIQFEIQDVLDAGDEVVMLVCNQHQWGRHSGIEVEFPPYAGVFTIQSGKITRVRWYPDQGSALEAVGLAR
jgi:ketosteroid isomerase-like protein